MNRTGCRVRQSAPDGSGRRARGAGSRGVGGGIRVVTCANQYSGQRLTFGQGRLLHPDLRRFICAGSKGMSRAVAATDPVAKVTWRFGARLRAIGCQSSALQPYVPAMPCWTGQSGPSSGRHGAKSDFREGSRCGDHPNRRDVDREALSWACPAPGVDGGGNRSSVSASRLQRSGGKVCA